MRARTKLLSTVVLILIVQIAADIPNVSAQTPRPRSSRTKGTPKTDVSFELLTGKSGVGLEAQRWGQLFQQLGIRLRIRNEIVGEKPKVSENTFGKIRVVKVIGMLDRSGKILLPGQSFARADAGKLREWVEELKAYGAQGAPQGKPAFGLNQSQFSSVYGALSIPVESTIKGRQLDKALSALRLPANYPLSLTKSAVERLREIRAPAARQTLKGRSKGTALAVLLNDYGLAFRPLRTAAGSIELSIEARQPAVEYWPIGWPQTKTNLQTAPALYKMVPVDLSDVPLPDVLDAISAATEISILIDYHSIEAKGINFAALKVSVPSRKTTWSLLLGSVTTPNRLSKRVVLDERGQPFVWVTTINIGKSKR